MPSPARFANDRPASPLVEPRLVAPVRFPKAEKTLRHATVQDWWQEG